MKPAALIGIALFLAIGGALYVAVRPGSSGQEGLLDHARADSGQVTDDGILVLSAGVGEPDPSNAAKTPDASSLTQRQEMGAAENGSGLRGRVVDAAGTGIANAELNWIAPRAQDMAWEAGWQVDDWGALDRSEVRVFSDATGNFAFAKSPQIEGLLGSAVWASAPGYVAACWLRGLGEEGVPLIVLEQSHSILVHVEDSAGNPVSGALVEQFGLTPRNASMEVGGALDRERLRRLLRREAYTGPDGSVRLSALPGEQVLRARLDNSVSVAWRGLAPESLHLRLEQRFAVGGTIVLPDWSHLNYEGERRIQIGIQEGSLWRGLASLRAVEAGTWGPVWLPLLPGTLYSVKLEGSPIIPITQHFKAPMNGESVSLDFSAELGHSAYIYGIDENGVPVSDVTATVWWDVDGVRQSITRRAPLGTAYANPWSMPACKLNFSVEAPGYAPALGIPFTLPEVETLAHAARLLPAGRLRGRVTHGGEPVENFDLEIWRRFKGSSLQTIAFRGRQDGRFEVSTAPLGELRVSASAAHLPPVRHQIVKVASEGSSEVLIELQTESVGVGRVVDLETGEPIGDAQLLVHTSLEGRSRTPLGLPQPVRSDGSFRVEGLGSLKNFIQVTAPGYAPLAITPMGVSGQEVDCGVVGLARPRSLELRLVSSDPKLDFTQYSATIDFPKLMGWTPFPTDGVLRCEVAPSGNYTIGIWTAAGQQASIDTAFFPGQPWVLQHRVGDGRRVEGHLIGSEEFAAGDVAKVTLLCSGPSGIRIEIPAVLNGEGGFVIEDVPGSTVSLTAIRKDDAFLGKAEGVFGDDDTLQLDLVLGGDPFVIEIETPEGRPVVSARLQMSEALGEPYFNYGSTDRSGVMHAFGIPERAVEVFVRHPDHGFGVLVIKASQEKRQFTLANDASMQVRLFDGDLPLSGAHAAIANAQGKRIYGYQPSAEDGSVYMQGYSTGPYRLLATHPHCWPVVFRAQAAPDAPAVEVQMRRLGNLQLLVSDEAGLALPNVRVHLTGEWGSGDVDSWIDEGRVESSGELTNGEGELSLRGLPHGSYRWRAGSQSGVLLVLPLKTEKVSLVLGG